MKKALSVILSVLVIFSMLGMFTVSAADASDLVKITFVVEGKVYKTIETKKDIIFVDRLQPDGDAALGVPTKASADGKEYTFKYWEVASGAVIDESGNCTYESLTGVTTSTSNVPAAKEDTVYVAVFAENEIKENQSFWAFVQSIFARINMIFEYFAKVFEGVVNFG